MAMPVSVIAADSAPAPAPKPDLTLDVYAQSARMVDIGGGRRLNLRCSGPQAAARTVLLEAGFGGDSMAWARVQPLLAKHGRADMLDCLPLGLGGCVACHDRQYSRCKRLHARPRSPRA